MLALKNITKVYAEKTDNAVQALKGINLAFRKKEFVSILGQSGCGKTTMLNIIGGLDRYTDGDLIINGKSTKEYKDKDWDTYRNHSIGFVFQSYNLIPHQTILENVELSMTLGGVEYSDRKRRAKDVLIKLGLGDKLNKKPTQLSGGQCQRVAIARAIVNEPDIILADEPTGALDSETSVTIMDILKEISKEKLVIMVTHNPELAEKYSDRIIRMFDGNLVNDSKPYSFIEEEKEVIESSKEVVDQIVYKKKHSSMSFFTALRLSGMNLLSKFRRTLITSIAASIGIIGIAVILSVSNGMQNYIDNSMNDLAQSNRVTIQSSQANITALTNQDSYEELMTVNMDKYPDTNLIYPYNSSDNLNKFITKQVITNDFVSYLKDVTTDKIIDISYGYSATLNIVSKSVSIDNTVTYTANSGLNGWSSSITNSDYLNEYYDTLLSIEGYESAIPKNYNDVVIVVDKYNRLSTDTLTSLGISYDTTINEDESKSYSSIDFNDLLNKEYKIVLNDLWYTKVSDNLYEAPKTSSDFESIYNSTDTSNIITVRVVGIVRAKEDAKSTMLSTGLVYYPTLIKEVINKNINSEITIAQKNNTTYNLTKGTKFIDWMGTTKETAYENAVRSLGGYDNPTSITIYPTSINTKNEIVESINEWNTNHEDQKMEYTDWSELANSVLGEMVNIITYVLMAFSITSLVISSIMIAIIIYASVIERTKEIGVLRSVGARKKDVARVFEAEAVILGAISGLIAILITIGLDIIINMVLVKLVEVDNIASLAPLTGFLLVCLSIFLLLIASLIPSGIAAKKEPAIALRTE